MSLLATGQTLCGGRYRIVRKAGQGGMQEVYEARDLSFDQVVALKTPLKATLHPKFEDSAQLSAKVSHPNSARTLDYFDENGRPHLVEEWVAGLDLQKTLERHGSLDPYAVAHILHHLARGLAAIHRHGLEHRDLKPSNIMVAVDQGHWTPKISDFGIARMAGRTIDAAARGGGAGLTTSTTALRALPYLAPEVVRSDAQRDDRRADVWAVGAIAWHLMTGAPPFGVGFMAVQGILGGQPPPLPSFIARSPGFRPLATEVQGIVLACMQPEPATRPTAKRLVELCSRLCYPDLERQAGAVNGYPGGTFGFISAEGGGEVFFHVESLYAEHPPPVGTPVWFQRYRGEPRDRAHPVVPYKDISK